MVLTSIATLTENPAPLQWTTCPDPEPAAGEVLLRISACGVCHTELDEIEGRTPPPYLPIIPGHQVVGSIQALGRGVTGLASGDRVGVAWIYSACGQCRFCRRGEENLCEDFLATGRDRNGGYAEWMTVPAAFVYPIPEVFSDAQAAPLLCAGAVGFRAVRLTGINNGQAMGLTGFGASGHLVLQLLKHRYPDTAVHVFARSEKERQFALEIGADWAGDSLERPPQLLDAIIDTTPAWTPVLGALQSLAPGGRLVINAIRKEAGDSQALSDLDYANHLWLEKEIKTVANVTRRDVTEFLQAAAEIPLMPAIQEYALKDANQALMDLRQKHIRGAKVLRID